MRARQVLPTKKKSAFIVKKTSAIVGHKEEEEEEEVVAAAAARPPPKAKKTVALQKAAKKTKVPSDKPVKDNLRIPHKTVRRFALRSGSVRCAADVYPVANETMRKTIDEVILMAMRSTTHDGRLTIKSRDVKRAMRVMNIRLY